MARYGRAWREQRRFSVSTMRNLGVGKQSLEQWITEEASYLCAAFSDQLGESRDMEGGLDTGRVRLGGPAGGPLICSVPSRPPL